MRRKGSTIERKRDTSLNVEHSFEPGQLYVSHNAVMLITRVENLGDMNLGLGGFVYITCLCSFKDGKEHKLDSYKLHELQPKTSWWVTYKVA